MKKNVIILTHGWTGSSVFSALLGTAGYWLGAETVKKVDYDTYENQGLVELNGQMMQELAFGQDQENEFSYDAVLDLERRADRLQLHPYRAFVARCESHAPWAWKDPRLTWTIRQWHRVLPVERMAFTQVHNHGITRSNVAYLKQHGLPHIKLSFEDLLLTPEKTLDGLDGFLGLDLTMDSLRSVFRDPLYRKSRSFKDHVIASLIYWKNYGERDGRGRRQTRTSPALIMRGAGSADLDVDTLRARTSTGHQG